MERTIILDEMQFDFTETQLAKFITYWNEYTKHSDDTIGIVKQIAKDMYFPVDNTFLVILHLKREGMI